MYRRAVFVALLVAGCASAFAERPTREIVSIFGPRVGATYMAVPTEDFDESMRETFGNMDRSYYPLFTQFGLHFEQRIPLGDTRSHFLFQEVLLLGGLDQNAALPSVSFLIGFRSAKGLEIGLGPNGSLAKVDGEAKIGISVVYGLGWTFTFQDVHVPVNLAVVPTPRDGHPRFSFLTGFNFFVGEENR